MPSVTVVIPAYNEGRAIRGVLEKARSVLNEAGIDAELMVVVDGATDNTAAEAATVADTVLEHPQNMGYGRSLKTGITAAKHDLIAIADADGTYPVERLPEMLQLAERFHMVVGARTGAFYQGGWVKQVGRFVFRHLSEFAAGQHIPDINSGLRVFRRGEIMPFFSVISAGFSFTTTSTLVYLLNDMFVHYIPIEYREREGKSKVRHIRDSLRALQIIVEAILRCNPIKIFLLLSFPFFLASALCVFFGLFAQHVLWLACCVAFLCTGSIILAMGCLSVSTMTRRRMNEDVHREARPALEHASAKPFMSDSGDSTNPSPDKGDDDA